MKTENFTMEMAGEDGELLSAVIKMGIDSRLEGFTKSTFEWLIHSTQSKPVPSSQYNPKWHGSLMAMKLHCNIHPDEMQILIRRLVEIGDYIHQDIPSHICENAFALADDIVETYYGIDLWMLEKQYPQEVA